ncbi:MAG: isoprenylcysteine carboxylmethyltransferase family protein [Pseudomonadota bacterium]|uniref:methyltransferase family protein n=1 Tax=Sphingomonas sp. ERG5 TaxID=1381597 RepID=UPI00190F3AAA|nr:isoprenylcysteine carboxylmethyltransferase family protein [Sphingomonas sp. ERG5]
MDQPLDPTAMSPTTAIIYAIGFPITLLALVFAPAGGLDWWPGWIFIAVLVVTFALSVGVIARINPVIFRARSRFQPGTKAWDKALLAVILPAMVAIIPLATFDAGRMHWSTVPMPLILLGYAALVGGIAGTSWAQAVNPFFEPGVRIQSERHQRVIDSGPYRLVRHPGYVAALLIFWGMPFALGSYWAAIPATLASTLLVLRTIWEDRLLRDGLPGYADYARRVQSRLLPGIW